MTSVIPDPHNLYVAGEQIAKGACIDPESVSELLLDAAKAWHADREKIAYLESLLLRK